MARALSGNVLKHGFMKQLYRLSALIMLTWANHTSAQCAYPLNIQQQWDLPFAFPKQCLATEHDANNKPYLYIAAKERGLLVVDITNTNNPILIDSVTVAALNNMEVMNLSQYGNYLYLAIGNHFVSSEKAGIAIVDVSNPAAIILKDTWIHNVSSGGAGIVVADDNYAYLGAMRQGLIILDVSDKSNISFVSRIKPSILYPDSTNPDSLKYNVRGLEVKDNKAYVCFDAGGLRVIDIADKMNPVQIGQYSNPAILNRPRAYNNIVLDGSLAYVAVDYCGMEVLNISNPSGITQVGWWNPWQCEVPAANNWFNSAGHTNDIKYNKNCKLLFMSSGKSEMQVVNVANPANPQLCDSFGNTTNSEGTWGLGIYQNQVYLSYIFVPLGIPFYSNWGGLKTLKWNNQCDLSVKQTLSGTGTTTIYPNPATDELHLVTSLQDEKPDVYDITGRLVTIPYKSIKPVEVILDVSRLKPGLYFLKFKSTVFRFTKTE